MDQATFAKARQNPVRLGRFYEEAPHRIEETSRTWILRSASFAVAYSTAAAGAEFLSPHFPDEHLAYCPDTPMQVTSQSEQASCQADSLAILPPGRSSIRLSGEGRLIRIFSRHSADLLEIGLDTGACTPEKADFAAWPEPPGGFRLRSYHLPDHDRPETLNRLFQSSNLMVNIFRPRLVPRDMAELSPHSHADFQQGSLALEGTWIHHLRFPWGKDMRQWQDDEHIEVASPSLIVIPETVIHTSQNLTSGRLIDIFAPPRADFAGKSGVVCNAADYPYPF